MMDVSNADRVVFPESGWTKGDVVSYYEIAGPVMLPLLANRPLTLQRFPKGLSEPGFMQKNAPPHYPDDITIWEVPKVGGGTTRYPVVTKLDSIPYLANQGTITFHAWTSTVLHPNHPDWLVIDLDPVEGDFDSVRQVAMVTKGVLDAYGLASLPVATGSKGFHVWARIDPAYDYSVVGRAARALAGIIELAIPDHATGAFLKKERDGKVFVDWLRNGPGSTVAVPLSLRPRPNASVSMPIDWDELPDTDPDQWTLDRALRRMSDVPAFPEASALPIAAIEDAAADLGMDLEASFDRFGRER